MILLLLIGLSITRSDMRNTLFKCLDGGIGRHVGLKLQLAYKASAGSNPVRGTKRECGFRVKHNLFILLVRVLCYPIL